MHPDRHARLVDADQRHLWHPFTQMQVWPEDDPLVIERAEGNYLIDDLGRRYLDGVSSLWVTVHGHRKKEIDDAIRAQLEKVAHTTLLGLASVPSIELAERLVRIAPKGLTRVFYSDSGSTSVEIAVKMAYQYCAAALASLELFEKERTLERIKPVMAALASKLERIAELPHVGEVRRRGMMVGIELVRDRRTKEEYAYGDRVGHQVCMAVRKKGIILRPLGNVVVLMPPLSLTVGEAERLGDVVREAIAEVTGS